MVDTYLRLRHPRRYQRDDRAVAFGHFDLGAMLHGTEML